MKISILMLLCFAVFILSIGIGALIVLLVLLSKRERPKKQYCYEETISKKTANELGNIDIIKQEKRSSVDGTNALSEFEIGK